MRARYEFVCVTTVWRCVFGNFLLLLFFFAEISPIQSDETFPFFTISTGALIERPACYCLFLLRSERAQQRVWTGPSRWALTPQDAVNGCLFFGATRSGPLVQGRGGGGGSGNVTWHLRTRSDVRLFLREFPVPQAILPHFRWHPSTEDAMLAPPESIIRGGWAGKLVFIDYRSTSDAERKPMSATLHRGRFSTISLNSKWSTTNKLIMIK